MNYSQIASIIGAILAVVTGALGIYLQWFSAGDGLGLIFAGLAILGVHTGGSVAGTIRARN
jgi:hypothetical protein